jgi:hypothetical protein
MALKEVLPTKKLLMYIIIFVAFIASKLASFASFLLMGGFLHYTPAVARLLVATIIDNTPKTLDNTTKTHHHQARVPSLSREQNYEAQQIGQIEPIPLVPWPISTHVPVE